MSFIVDKTHVPSINQCDSHMTSTAEPYNKKQNNDLIPGILSLLFGHP